MRECYNTPQSVYDTAKRRGMDLVTVTDHDQINGALELAHRPAIDAVSQRAGRLYVIESRGVWHQRAADGRSSRGDPAVVDGLEVINGTRLPSQNRTALCLAQATGKHLLGGGDAHTGRGIGLTWTEVPGARSREEFMAGLRAGRAVAAGDHGGHRTMLSDMWRFAGNFLTEGVSTMAGHPANWRGYACTFGGVLGLPVMPLVMAGAFVHFVHEQRFNRDLLYDLLAKPSAAARMAPGLAA